MITQENCWGHRIPVQTDDDWGDHITFEGEEGDD